jgi:DNA-binding response OmpR family regulator
MARVLVVEDSPEQAKDVESILRAADYEVEVATHARAAIESVRRRPPDLVLTEMHMGDMSGLELVEALRAEFPAIPVVMSAEVGSEELAVQSLRSGASGYLPKRNLARDVVALADEILSVSASQQKLSQFLTRMTVAEYQFTLENNPDLISQVVSQVESVLRTMQLFDAAEHLRIGVAVHEATVNAMVHGNLEISSDLKTDDWDAYHAEIATRSACEPYSKRRVHVTIRATRAPSLEVRVTDEGHGYDPALLPDPTDPANLDRACGRGLLLIRTFFDEVRHGKNGTEIVMVKHGH